MSASVRSEEFGFKTRMVVYNFLSLVPTTQFEDEAERFHHDQPFDGKSASSPAWNDTLKTQPPLPEIDKVKHVEPPLVQNQLNDEGGSKDHKHDEKHAKKQKLEQDQQAPLNEPKGTVPTRGRSLHNSTNEEPAPAPITIIQKGYRLKILGESAITPSEEADIIQKFNSFSSAVHSDTRPAVQVMPHTALVGDMTVMPGKEILSQIDEKSALDLNSSEFSKERSGDKLQSQDVSGPLAPVQSSASRPSTLMSTTPFERQSSLSSGRRCSAYIDITQPKVNVESLVESNALPPVTLDLKRELLQAIKELEKSRQTDMCDEVDGGAESAVSPESEVANRGDEVDGAESAVSPESEVAYRLRMLGDEIQEKYCSQLNVMAGSILGLKPGSSINYDILQSMASQLVQQTPDGWTKVGLVMLLGQRLVYETLRQGYSGISKIAEYTAKLVEDNVAEFIISKGGWDQIKNIGTETIKNLQSPSDTECMTVRE